MTVDVFGLGRRTLDRVGGPGSQPRVAVAAFGSRARSAPGADAPRGSGVRRRPCAAGGVAIFGEVRNGARRWLNLGFGTLQPSEIMKIAVPLMSAWYFHRQQEGLRLKDYLVAGMTARANPQTTELAVTFDDDDFARTFVAVNAATTRS